MEGIPLTGGGPLSTAERSSSSARRSSAARCRPRPVARVESVSGVRFVQLNRDGRVRDAARTPRTSSRRGRVLLRGGMPASALDHVVGSAPRLEWIHSFSAGVDAVATPIVRSRGLTVTNARGVFSRRSPSTW